MEWSLPFASSRNDGIWHFPCLTARQPLRRVAFCQKHLSVCVLACHASQPGALTPAAPQRRQLQRQETAMAEEFRIVSPAIDHGGRIPRKYRGDGQGALKHLSPPLEWYSVPDGTKSLALVVEDIDAPDPSGPIVPWTHWVVVNIPSTIHRLPEGFSGKEEEASGDYAGIKEGNNDWEVPEWRGPKPPTFGYRYRFRMYALDEMMNLGNKVTKDKLLDSIKGHVLGEAELIGVF